MIRTTNIRRIAARALRGILGLLLCMVLAIVFYLSTLGFPRWLITELTKKVNSGNWAVEMGAVRLDLLNGIVLEDTRLYRKKLIGPAAVEAKRIIVAVDPLARMRDEPVPKRMKIIDGVVRPALMRWQETSLPEETGTARMNVELENCLVQGVNFKTLACRLNSDERGWKIDRMEGTAGNSDMKGTFEGVIAYDVRTKVLTGHAVTRLDPHIFVQMFEESGMPFAAELTRRFEFGKKPPVCDFEFNRSLGKEDSLAIEGEVRFEDAKYRGVEVRRVDSRISMSFSGTNSTISVGPLILARREGLLDGKLRADTEAETVDFDGVSTIDPRALAQMLGILTNGVMDTWRFEGPVRITASGRTGYSDYNRTDFTGAVEGRGMGVGPFVSDDCAFNMRMVGSTNTLSRIRGTIYGGEFAGEVKLVLPPASGSETDTAYVVEASVKNADFGKIAKALALKQDQGTKSTFSGNARVQGLAGTGNSGTATGEGSFIVKDGKIFSLPIFGGLSQVMANVIPGLDFIMRQTDARADFEIGNGRMHSEKVAIEGDVLSLAGRGDYRFNGEVDFEAQIKLMREHTLVARLLRALTYPITKLFEFRLRGTMDEPKWYPVNFSKDLLEKIGLGDGEKGKERAP